MNTIKKTELDKIFEETDKTSDLDAIQDQISDLFKKSVEKKAILSMDIVGYSKYNLEIQILIPYIFHELYRITCNHITDNEEFFFQNLKTLTNFKDYFIDTGDGGFQAFDNPLQALIFAIYFQLNLKKFNSFKTNYKLREIVGKVNLRFAITYDDFYKIERNYYGSAIINCARILSKDKLDRFLIDDRTFDWFEYNLNGIENLIKLDISELSKIEIFKNFNEASKTTIIANSKENFFPFISSDIQKIGMINSKNTIINIYNYHAQIMLYSGFLMESNQLSKFTCTLGNLNHTGLTD